MLRHRVFPVNQRSLPLKVTSKVFIDEWRECLKDKKRSLNTLWQMLTPAFDHWEAMFLGNAKKDIGYASMYMSLKSRNRGYDVLENWIEQTTLISSIRDELQTVWLLTIKRMRYFPWLAKPKMAEYVIARQFIFRMQDHIDGNSKRRIETVPLESKHDVESYEDSHPDYLLLKNSKLSDWELYLLTLTIEGLAVLDIANTCHIPRETFYYEEKKIWKKLARS